MADKREVRGAWLLILPWLGMILGACTGAFIGRHWGDEESWADISGAVGGAVIGLILGILAMPIIDRGRR